MVSDNDVTIRLNISGDDPDDVAALDGPMVVVDTQTDFVPALGSFQILAKRLTHIGCWPLLTTQ